MSGDPARGALSQQLLLRARPLTNTPARSATGFVETLDYVFADGGFAGKRAPAPIPTRDDIAKLGAMPNHLYPSDHLALCADVVFVDSKISSG